MPRSLVLEQVDSSQSFEIGFSEPMSAADGFDDFGSFRGRLDQIGLPSLLCILEMERKTGILVLIVEPEREQAHLHLSEGRVFRADLEGREEPRNAELVYGLLARTRGTFDFCPSSVDLDDKMRCSTTRLIFEGARRIDKALLAPGLETVTGFGHGVDLQENTGLSRRVILESPPAPCGGGQNEAFPVDRRAPEPGKGPNGPRSCRKEGLPTASSFHEMRSAASDPSRRWALARAAVAALLMTCFALALLTTVFRTDPGTPDSSSTEGAHPPIPIPSVPTR